MHAVPVEKQFVLELQRILMPFEIASILFHPVQFRDELDQAIMITQHVVNAALWIGVSEFAQPKNRIANGMRMFGKRAPAKIEDVTIEHQ